MLASGLSIPVRVPAPLRARPRAAGGGLAYRAAKRAFDAAFALLVLVAVAPLIVVAALAIRIETPGPAFFRQRRLGRDGATFELLKLRGMYADARSRFPDLYDYARTDAAGASSYFFHARADPRVTRVGRFLRTYSIDELPNFWNVLRGHMSVVGPRPEIPELAHLYPPDELALLLSVRPGVTSPAKARYRDELPLATTLQLELDYVANRSLRLDLATVGLTAANVVRGRSVW